MMMKTTVDLKTAILDGWKRYLETGQTAPAKRPYCYASSFHPCIRHLTLLMTDGDKLPPFEAEVLAKFRRGNDRERDLLTDLPHIGRMTDPPFDVVGGQERFELLDRKNRIAIVGKVDARLHFRSLGIKAPIEVKSWHPNLTDRINTFLDLMNSPWTRAGAYQLLMYLLGSGEETGFMLLDRSGIPNLIEVSLMDHLGMAEDFLNRAEEAMDYKESETLPPFSSDAGECRRCKFYGALCNPPISSDAASILTDEDLIQNLERRHELEEAAKEYGKLDEAVKEKIRGIELGICGDFLIEGKWGKLVKYDIPEDIKQQYKIVNPKGRFSPKITRVNAVITDALHSVH